LRLSRPFYFTVLFYLGKTLGVHPPCRRLRVPQVQPSSFRSSQGSDLAPATHPAGSNIARPATQLRTPMAWYP
jgi:hypothetical protein